MARLRPAPPAGTAHVHGEWGQSHAGILCHAGAPTKAPPVWESLLTSYPPGGVEMCESQAAQGAGGLLVAKVRGEVAAAVAVGKWESRVLCGIPKRSGKVCFWTFPRSVFSTAPGLAPTRTAGIIPALWNPDTSSWSVT